MIAGLLESVGAAGSEEEASAAVRAKAYGSEVALQLGSSHNALVRGGKKQQKRWLEVRGVV